MSRAAAAFVVLLALAGLGAPPAEAVTVESSFGPYVFPLAAHDEDIFIDFTLFPNWGVLTGVTLKFYFEFQPSLLAINGEGQPLVLTGGRIEVDGAQVIGPDGTAVVPGLLSYSYDPLVVLPGLEVNEFEGPLVTTAYYTVPASELAAYMGPGQYVNGLTFKAPSITTSWEVSEGIVVGGSALVGATGWVVYEHVVPEPSALVLFGFGAGLLFLRPFLVRSR